MEEICEGCNYNKGYTCDVDFTVPLILPFDAKCKKEEDPEVIEDSIEDHAEYYKRMVDEGFIDEKGCPLKCQRCGNKEFTTIHFFEECGVVEMEVFCTECTIQVGYWSYGSWQI